MENNKNDRNGQLPVYETFFAFQGEGIYLGCAAFFIRTYGCPVQCDWCDSANTWKKVADNAPLIWMNVADLADKALKSGSGIVVITGGEPTIHDLNPLTNALHANGLRVHLETCGTFPIRGTFDWITLSPKWKSLPLAENISLADEFKIIVEDEFSIPKWWEVIRKDYPADSVRDRKPNIWLQPEYETLLSDPKLLDTITLAVKEHPDRYRAGVQLHKLYKCDELDPESKSLPVIPLVK